MPRKRAVGTSWKVNVLKLARAAGLTHVLGKKYDYDKESHP